MNDPRDIPILQVWKDLGGSLPERSGGRVVRVCRFWAKSTIPNIALYPQNNTYTYFGLQGEAGGTVRLVMFRYQCDGKQARQWLKEQYGGQFETPAVFHGHEYTPHQVAHAEAFRCEMLNYLDTKLEVLAAMPGSAERAAAVGAYTTTRSALANLVYPTGRPKDAAKLVETHQAICKQDPALALVIEKRVEENRNVYRAMIRAARSR